MPQTPSGNGRVRRFSVGAPDFYATAADVSPSAAQLLVSTEKVFDSLVDLPAPAVEVVASAGHLSSSSVYPACRTPYFVVVSCEDNSVQFLRCSKQASDNQTLVWEPWSMVSGTSDSSLDVPGRRGPTSSVVFRHHLRRCLRPQRTVRVCLQALRRAHVHGRGSVRARNQHCRLRVRELGRRGVASGGASARRQLPGQAGLQVPGVQSLVRDWRRAADRQQR